MSKIKTTALALLLAIAVAAGAGGAIALTAQKAETASAMSTETTMTYPFKKGNTAFVYAPTYTAAQGTGKWLFAQVKFSSLTNFTDVEYVGVQMRVDKGEVGLTIGLIENADRYNTKQAGASVYFLSEDTGKIEEIPITNGDQVKLKAGMKGALILPMDSMDWQWNNEHSDLTKVSSLYWTAIDNAYYDYAITVGDICIWKGEPDAASATQLLTLTAEIHSASTYYTDGYTQSYVSDNSYPKISWNDTFRVPSEENAYGFKNTVEWTGTSSASGTQSLKIAFDAAADLSEKTHILVQYYNPAWANPPRLQFKLAAGGTTYALKANERVFFLGQTGTWARNAYTTNAQGVVVNDTKNDNISVSAACRLMGAIVLPIEAFDTQKTNLTAIDSIVIEMAAKGNVDLVFGEVAAYVGEYGDGTYSGGTSTKLLDLTSEKTEKYTATETSKAKLEARPAVSEKVQGDTQLSSFLKEENADDKYRNKTGALGEATVTQDSYGQTAIQFEATGANPDGGDAYYAVNELGAGFIWAGMKGITLWARNDGETEVDFNFEVDCQAVGTLAGERYVMFDRFNLQQGSRYWLYDVRTERTSVYMTRDTVTLPVGFEGWVRIPFSAFYRTGWTGKGVSKDDFMSENSVVSYIGISVLTPNQQEKPFSINMLGAYKETPSFGSCIVDAGNKTIKDLMDLDNSDLELQDPIEAPSSISLDDIDLIPANKEEK